MAIKERILAEKFASPHYDSLLFLLTFDVLNLQHSSLGVILRALKSATILLLVMRIVYRKRQQYLYLLMRTMHIKSQRVI